MKKKMFMGASELIFKNAALLRNNLTPAEMLLWGHLKGSQLGAKFRRQHPLGIYIADFYCHQHKIVIELDGGIHNLPEIVKNDLERQLNIENDGIRVLRFKNEEIFNQLENVLATIKQTINSPFRGSGGIGIITYGAGNIFSLTAALERLGIPYGMIKTEQDFDRFDRYIIPGVGHAGTAMNKLEQTGLVPTIKSLTKPTLGICVGMQLLTSHSEEGDANLLNIIPVKTLRFTTNAHYKVPHTGWNRVFPEKENPLFENIPYGSHFYFVHSYFIEYNNKFSASIWRDNFYGVQFHPEKSGAYGETLLKNFSKL